MSEHSSIEWTDATWNPVRGCTKVSEGCAHCYAERDAERFRGVPGHPYEHGFDLRLVPKMLSAPAKWSRPRNVFVNSMSDLFHEKIPISYIATVCEAMRMANWHVFQVLTKRSEQMRDLLNGELEWAAKLPNVIWGVSVENRKHGLPRIEHLRQSKAKWRFLSVEPLLEDLGEVDFSGIDWVIVGGESGPRSRPMEEDWVLRIRKQCRAAKVPFFFKQWGGWNKKKSGRTLQGRTYDAMPRIKASELPDLNERRRAVSEIEKLAEGHYLEVPRYSLIQIDVHRTTWS